MNSWMKWCLKRESEGELEKDAVDIEMLYGLDILNNWDKEADLNWSL